MAPGGRTWAQIAAGVQPGGLPAADSPGAPVAKDVNPAHATATAALPSSSPSKAEQDCEGVRGMMPAEVVQVEPNAAASKDELVQSVPEADAAAPKQKGAPPSLGEAQTERCVSASTVPHNLASAITVPHSPPQCPTVPSSVLRSTSGSDLSSTAASERERSDNCILCSGSGLLCVGLLSDPCPLCEQGGLSIAEDINGSSASDGSELERAEATGTAEASEQIGKEQEDCGSGSDDSNSKKDGPSVNIKGGTAMTAPPGLGPPGIWLWDDVNASKESDATKSDAKNGDIVVNWPETSSDSPEVEFVGKLAQVCFGSDFMKMTVSWSEPWVRGNLTLSTADLQLHLEPSALSNFLPPLARLQAVLSRDAGVHQCHIFRMDRSKDNCSLAINMAKVSTNTCWDVLKAGFCPREKCTWEHPAPTLLSVSCAGDNGQPDLPTLMPEVRAAATSDQMSKDAEPFQPAGLSNVQLNFAAFMDDSSDSSEEP